jgi:hypothetical protein
MSMMLASAQEGWSTLWWKYYWSNEGHRQVLIFVLPAPWFFYFLTSISCLEFLCWLASLVSFTVLFLFLYIVVVIYPCSTIDFVQRKFHRRTSPFVVILLNVGILWTSIPPSLTLMSSWDIIMEAYLFPIQVRVLIQSHTFELVPRSIKHTSNVDPVCV